MRTWTFDTSSITAEEIFDLARESLQYEGPKDAQERFEKALAQYRKDGDRTGEATTLRAIGTCHRLLGDFPLALSSLNLARALNQELDDRLSEAKTLNNLGLVYWDMGDYAEAIDHLELAIPRAREHDNKEVEAAILNNLSLVYDELGDYRRSLRQYHRALELYRGTGFVQGEADTLGNIGGVHLLLGHYREAIEYYRKAFELSRGLESVASMTRDLTNIALGQLGVGRVDRAIANFDSALVLARDAGLKKEEAACLRGKGTAYGILGQYDRALELHEQALATYEEAGLKRDLVDGLNESGAVHVLLGDVTSGEASFRRAIDTSAEMGYTLGVTTNLMALGDLEKRRERPARAGELFRQALERARRDELRAESTAALLQLASVELHQGLLEAARSRGEEALALARSIDSLHLQARSLELLGETALASDRAAEAKTHYEAASAIVDTIDSPELRWRIAYRSGQVLQRLDRMDQALSSYQRAVDTIETVRSQLSAERFRAGYLDDKQEVYLAVVRLLLDLKRPEQALEYSERLRARKYLELLGQRLPPIQEASVRQSEVELRERLRQLERELGRERSAPLDQQRVSAIGLFESELAKTERAYQNLLDDLKRSEPAYAEARALRVPTANDIQTRLSTGTALLEILTDDDGIVLLLATGDRLDGLMLPVLPVDLRAKVELLRDLIERKEGDAWRNPARSLGELLIQPIREAGLLNDIDRIYISPHGVLHYLPFSVLLTERDGVEAPLIESYDLAILPSAALLMPSSPASPPDSKAGLLALAPRSGDLPHISQEVESLGELFREHSAVLNGAGATETAFKEAASRFSLLHLATHGDFNKLNPLMSRLELEPDRWNDGRLEVHEILDLRLNAQLVTLSACDTALGSGYFAELPAGDDFVGLTRAFLYAGSDSVLATLWPVNDRSTRAFMVDFYRRLQSEDRASSLAGAQRAMSRSSDRSHPYYWAAFSLVGTSDSGEERRVADGPWRRPRR